MRAVVGERAKEKTSVSVSQMGRFETEILTQPCFCANFQQSCLGKENA